jgi:uncharacterized protein
MKKCALLLLVFTHVALHGEVGYVEPWGHDSALLHTEKKAPTKKKNSLVVKAMGLAIDFHQKVLSPVDGPRSHYRPSSSQYMRLALEKHGFIKGFIMGCDRLLRENKDPWVYRKVQEEGQLFKWDTP